MPANKKKTRILIILWALILVVSVCGFVKWNKDFLLLWNANTINVTAEAPLTTDKVKIEFGISVHSYKDSIFTPREQYTIVYDGGIKHLVYNDYGENDFLVTYSNRYYCLFRHFKSNRRHQHDYHFHFYKKDSKVFIQVDIKGKSSMHITKQMCEIGDIK